MNVKPAHFAHFSVLGLHPQQQDLHQGLDLMNPILTTIKEADQIIKPRPHQEAVIPNMTSLTAHKELETEDVIL